MPIVQAALRLGYLWLGIGVCLVVFVIYETLTAHPVDIGVQVSDKYLHTVGYFALMGWFVQLYDTVRARLVLAVFFILMGIGLEFLQELGGVRYFEVLDMVANGLGVVIAWLLSYSRFSKILYLVESLVFRK